MLIVYSVGSFLLVRPMDQQQKQLAVRFYSRWYEVRSWYISQANQVSYEKDGGNIHYISPMALTKQFFLFGLSFSHLKNIFHS